MASLITTQSPLTALVTSHRGHNTNSISSPGYKSPCRQHTNCENLTGIDKWIGMHIKTPTKADILNFSFLYMNQKSFISSSIIYHISSQVNTQPIAHVHEVLLMVIM